MPPSPSLSPLFFLLLVPLAVLALAGCDSAGGMEDVPTELRIRLQGQLVLASPGMIHSDVWGYVDEATGQEYALVGGLGQGAGAPDALFVVDVSDPAAPVLVATVDVPGFDMKVWGHYAYTVTGGGDGGQNLGRIVDLSDPADPQVVGAFPSSHNVFIDADGFMYLEAPGLRIFDLTADPIRPALVWADDGNGGHDAAVIDGRLYDFHGRGGTNIYDVTTPSSPQLLGAITLPSIAYHHSGWTAGADDGYLFLCDELANGPAPDVTVWDVRNPESPSLVAEIGDDMATVHNLYVVDDLAYLSYYHAGFRVYDVADPAAPVLVDEFDTAPEATGQGYGGAWGVYPFAPSGTVLVSDTRNGLFLFTLVEEPIGDEE